MKFRTLIAATAISMLALAAGAATIVVPAAGTGPGAYDSQWKSELTLHSAAPREVEVSVAFHQGTTVLGPVAVRIQPRGTVSIPDVAKTSFGLTSGNGALVIEVADRDARALAVTSRTFNTSATGEYGQDIAACDIGSAARAGEIAALTGPSASAGTRFNFGIYSVTASKVTWELVRANGTVAATKLESYNAGQHTQYTIGTASLLGATPADNDTVYARITEGNAIVYGSAVNATGDPTFVPGIRTRDDIQILFSGVDLDENGTVDVTDADGDGVLDTPITIYTSLYPAYFRVIAEGEFGEAVSLEVDSSPAFTDLSGGTMRVTAGGNLKGQSGQIKILATSGNSSRILTIPVLFK